MKTVGQFEIMLDRGGGMFAVKAFDAVQSRLDHGRDCLVGPVQSRMSHDRHAAGLVNEFDRLRSGHFKLWHPGGPILLEEPFESLIQAAAKAGLDQRSGYVWP